MIFERENAQSINNPSAKALAKELKKLKSYGPSSYASLTAKDGSYIQVAGGGVACLLEWRTVHQQHFRAYQLPPVMPSDFKDGTILSFSGGQIPLQRDEWFRIEQVIEAFTEFNNRSLFPNYIQWRDITSLFQ